MRVGSQVDLIGQSTVIRDLRAELQRVAQSDAKVLLTGESGAGSTGSLSRWSRGERPAASWPGWR